MSKVRLEFFSWLADTLAVEGTGGEIILEEGIEENKTVRDVLSHLAVGHPRFGELIFDVKTQKLIGRVSIFFNGRLLEMANGLDTRLRDGDVLTFVPPIEGG